jgi:nucleotide-binding universal stress UspA family protein
MIKRILVALSGTPFTASAVQRALELAHLHDAHVTGVTLFDVRRLEHVGPVPLGGAAAAHELAEHRIHVVQERIEKEILSFENACRSSGTSCDVDRETGDVLGQLISLWRYHDVTVFGLRGLFEYGVVHNPDNVIVQLIAHGVRPIIAVAEQHRPIRRVLIGYNGSMESAKSMKRFVQMRLWPEVELKIVCLGKAEEEGRKLLADAAAYCRSHGFEAETGSVQGHARDGLVNEAKAWSADLVVMGSTSRGKIAKLILGDTAEYTMRHAEIPLFLSQ